MDLNEQTFLATYKALIVSILRPKLDFDLLIDGISSIRDQLVQDIDACKTYDEVLQYINKAYTKITDEIKAKKVVIPETTVPIVNMYQFRFITTTFFAFISSVILV